MEGRSPRPTIRFQWTRSSSSTITLGATRTVLGPRGGRYPPGHVMVGEVPRRDALRNNQVVAMPRDINDVKLP